MIFFTPNRLKAALSIISLCVSFNIYASENRNENVYLNQFIKKYNLAFSHNFDFDQAKEVIWLKYLDSADKLSSLKTEYDNRAIKFKDKTMRFSLEKIGEAPKDGYPLYIALHGGGQTRPDVNDSQWEHMKIYYRDSVQNGIYVATRGITDNWKLHFEDESYPLYDKLIESAMLFDNVDPNRIYFMGFSAGGDGVYQVVPRMPDRFAAANMSAGHHNWIPFDNLYNTPFLMQVGELDDAYKRNTVAAENSITMDNLQLKYNGGFIHDVYIHYDSYHNGWYDNDAFHNLHPVIADPADWLKNGDRHTKSVNSNAVDWMNQYTRNPAPEKLVWDLSTGADMRVYQTGEEILGNNGNNVKEKVLGKPNTLFYWLDVSVADEFPAKGKLVVETVKATNTIKVLEAENVDKFRILLNPHMLNLSIPVTVEVGDQRIGRLKVREDFVYMVRTLFERSDKNEMYDAEITLAYNKNSKIWEISK